MAARRPLPALSAALFLFSVGVPAPAYAQAAGQAPASASSTAFPSTPPVPGPPRDFHVPEPKRFTLDNGLEVALVQWGTMPKARVMLDVRTGNVFEKANQTWLADLTGNLIREGTATRNGTEISQQVARMGGSLAISVGEDETNIGGDVLTEFTPQMAELVADVAQHPRFPESELPRIKANMVRQLSISLSQPQALAVQKFRAVLYGDHPYGRLFPTEDMINGYTIDESRAFYQATYGAGRARLYVVGRFDAAATEAAIRKAFAGWAKGSPVQVQPPAPKSERAVYLVDRPGAPQSTVLIGMPSLSPTNDDFVAMTVMDALLGGSFASRITKNIREDKGYTYSPSSDLSTRYHDAYWVEAADVTTNVTGPSIKEIFGEIDRLQKEPPSSDELQGIQNFLAGFFVFQNSSRAGITAQLEYIDLQGLPADYANTYVKRVYAVTPDKISDVAREYLKDDDATIVIVGDRKVIEEQVRPFGKVIEGAAQPIGR